MVSFPSKIPCTMWLPGTDCDGLCVIMSGLVGNAGNKMIILTEKLYSSSEPASKVSEGHATYDTISSSIDHFVSGSPLDIHNRTQVQGGIFLLGLDLQK